MRIILTGAAGGIGRAIVDSCIKTGYSIAAVDKSSASIESLARQYPSEQLRAYVCDLADPASLESLFKGELSSWDPTALINNAGIYPALNLDEYSFEDALEVFKVNVVSAGIISQRFARVCAGQGSIVNISSVVAHTGSLDVFYAASKSALVGLTKSLALTLAPEIRVNAVAPGIVDTPMMKKIAPDRLTKYRARELLSYPVSAQDVAATVGFLLSEAARNYTGAVFDVNNGLHF